ncbi:hypothetical protein SARC_02827 [Sphaeroforma arctica JP610]|uniref:Uncharacterized protein n=1 Tax=Sphaeroforma arctica JP610 TaxID=667725 RepID=A0A0L0G7F7_9EUKA|nr:hypothetical protein SARC_02827 [Sphaeroforma arctica JP610]KNC84972.1 hypothetical protein SARC_02827 [Sphaeroforma arctica JP610]|eukprot:XP_014158874.1 hypothetical protein SARC_02827 [Sphaeroforma arctica JP610]
MTQVYAQCGAVVQFGWGILSDKGDLAAIDMHMLEANVGFGAVEDLPGRFAVRISVVATNILDESSMV